MAPVDQVTAGSISHGTMQEEDLIPAFLGELRRLDPERADDLNRNHEAALAVQALSGPQAQAENVESEEFLNELFDILEEYAPEGLYFGAHVGDGSDYGFWPVEEVA